MDGKDIMKGPVTMTNLTLEKDIEQKLVRIVKAADGLCLKWVSPGCAGVPDRICILPGGKIIFVELKRPKGGALSIRQKFFLRALSNLGCNTAVIHSEADLKIFKLTIVGKEVIT